MKALIITLASVCALSLLAATPTVEQDDVTMTQSGRKVLITYTLRNAPAIITVDIQTNDTATGWVSIGAENFTSLVGEVNKIVRTLDVAHTITWQAKADWPNHEVAGGNIRAVVKAWALDAPPDYLVADLSGSKLHKFYASEKAIPNGVHAAEYKTTKMVFRRIPAAGVTWRMGAPSSEAGTGPSESKAGTTIHYWEEEIPHYVALSDDYYMAIYPLTQQQCYNLIGTYRNSNGSGIAPSDEDFIYTPANHMYGSNLRGTQAQPSSTPSTDSAIGKARGLTGLTGIDLPTDAQWEYACRAGSGTAYFFGDSSATLGDYAWYGSEAGGKPHPVGMKAANPWGLYDILGNVGEWTLDIWAWGDNYKETFGAEWQADNTVTVVDPVVLTNVWGKGPYGAVRGGFYGDANATNLRSARRWCYNLDVANNNDGHLGCRFVCPAVFE